MNIAREIEWPYLPPKSYQESRNTMPKLQTLTVQAQDVKVGDRLLTPDVPVKGLLVTGSYALGEGRWALDLPGIQLMMQFNATDEVHINREVD